MPLSEIVEGYRQFIVDLDGCVWLGSTPIPGSVEAIGCLRGSGKRVAFATNNPRRGNRDYVRKLSGIGIPVSSEDVVGVCDAVTDALASSHTGSRAVVIGAPPLVEAVEAAGVRIAGPEDEEPADIVVVGGTEELSYDDLRSATLAVNAGAELFATGRDPTYPMPDGLWPGTGAIVAAVEYATGRSAQVIGKPEPNLIRAALRRMGEGRTLVVGDRLDSDVAAATSAGLDAALVLTGGTREDEVGPGSAPESLAVADSLLDLVQEGARYPLRALAGAS
jgi:glycerol 3-phosphatase-2